MFVWTTWPCRRLHRQTLVILLLRISDLIQQVDRVWRLWRRQVDLDDGHAICSLLYAVRLWIYRQNSNINRILATKGLWKIIIYTFIIPSACMNIDCWHQIFTYSLYKGGPIFSFWLWIRLYFSLFRAVTVNNVLSVSKLKNNEIRKHACVRTAGCRKLWEGLIPLKKDGIKRKVQYLETLNKNLKAVSNLKLYRPYKQWPQSYHQISYKSALMQQNSMLCSH